MTERICIVGCGAIGALYAAHLATLREVEVWVYDIVPEHVEAINRDGLRLTGHTELVAPVQARTDPEEIPPCRFGIVATKGTVTRAAIAATAPIFRDAAVCSVQNGIGNEEVIAEYVPRVMRGVTMPAGHLVSPGVIHMDAPGTTWIGPFEPRPATMAEVEKLGTLLIRAGMPACMREDVRGAQWTKLLFNASTNPVAALTGLTQGQLCTHEPTRRLVSALLHESRTVAAALGIALDQDPEVLIDESVRVNYYHRPSMLQDVRARRPTEIATLNGGIVQAAVPLGIPTPLNEAVVSLIRGLEQSWSI